KELGRELRADRRNDERASATHELRHVGVRRAAIRDAQGWIHHDADPREIGLGPETNDVGHLLVGSGNPSSVPGETSATGKKQSRTSGASPVLRVMCASPAGMWIVSPAFTASVESPA